MLLLKIGGFDVKRTIRLVLLTKFSSTPSGEKWEGVSGGYCQSCWSGIPTKKGFYRKNKSHHWVVAIISTSRYLEVAVPRMRFNYHVSNVMPFGNRSFSLAARLFRWVEVWNIFKWRINRLYHFLVRSMKTNHFLPDEHTDTYTWP